jgi:FixJ family two-component response regulator
MFEMRKRYIVNLTSDERAALTDMTRRRRVSGLKRQRANILLKADEDLTDQEIADELEVGLVTVERVRKRGIERSRSVSGEKGVRSDISAAEARWRRRGAAGAACVQ